MSKLDQAIRDIQAEVSRRDHVINGLRDDLAELEEENADLRDRITELEGLLQPEERPQDYHPTRSTT